MSVKVAFVGISFRNLKPETQERIMREVLTLMVTEPSLKVLKPEDLRRTIGEEKISQILERHSKETLAELAKQLDVDYVFAGALSNRSEDPKRILLVGTFDRYDRTDNKYFSLEILNYYEDFYKELIKIKNQFIATILPSPEPGILKKWPIFVIAALVLGGVLALLLAGGKSSEEGPPNPGPIAN